MLLDYITKDEKRMIDAARELYATNGYTPAASCDEYLKYWNENKINLFKILGNSLTYEFPYKFEINTDYNAYLLGKNYHFVELIDDFCDKFRWKNYDKVVDTQELSYFCNMLKNYKNLILNKVDATYKIFPDERPILKGSRIMSTLQKLNKKYNIISPSELEELRNIVSTYTQVKSQEGNFHFSIHPLDYITMSDNDEDWTSCMSWKEEGCYRAGTVEMMNSPYVIVGYLANTKTKYVYTDYWNNKIWRVLYIVSEGIITSIKSYPYYSEELIKIGLNKLKELTENNMGWYYTEDIKTTDYSNYILSELEEEWNISFLTNAMYNDFGCAPYHFGYIHKDYKNVLKPFSSNFRWDKNIFKVDLNYSGPMVCANCGLDYVPYTDGEIGTRFLTCPECGDYTQCYDCSGVIENHNAYYIEGYDFPLCEECYENRTYNEE